MFGKNKNLEPIQHQQQIIQQPINPLETDIKEINRTLENTEIFLKEVTGICQRLAGRVEAIESNKSPEINSMTDAKRLTNVEANILSVRLSMDALSSEVKICMTEMEQIKEIIQNLMYEIKRVVPEFGQETKVKTKKKKPKRRTKHRAETDEDIDYSVIEEVDAEEE